MRHRTGSLVVTLALAATLFAPAARAADRVRLIDSTKGPFGDFAIYQAVAEGYFKKAGLDVPVIFGSGGAATLQTLITGDEDIAYGVGIMSVIGAFAKGAPVVILANAALGFGEIFWYVPVSSPIKTLADLKGHTLAYSRHGSTTDFASNALLETYHIDAKRVAVGGMASARTQAMSGQIDTGWAAAPEGLDLIRTGKARIIARGSQAGPLNSLTVRVAAANSHWLKAHRKVAKRFMRELWRGMLFNYIGGDVAIERYAKKWNLNIADAKRAPEFVPINTVAFAPIGNLPEVLKMAQKFHFIDKPLTKKQIDELVDIVYDPLRD